jgi:hypothetical protein
VYLQCKPLRRGKDLWGTVVGGDPLPHGFFDTLHGLIIVTRIVMEEG